jgi:hypothetical protein
VLGLHAEGASSGIASALTALEGVRNNGGGWGFLARSDQATDANSSGLVLEAILSTSGTTDSAPRTALEKWCTRTRFALFVLIGRVCGGSPKESR